MNSDALLFTGEITYCCKIYENRSKVCYKNESINELTIKKRRRKGGLLLSSAKI